MPQKKSGETFKKPLLDKIVFQAIYPNLFYLENKIGDFQLKIIEKFPDSSLIFRQQFIFADLGSNVKAEAPKLPEQNELGNKIWQFKSSTAEANVSTSSIDISTSIIKLYSGETGCFRDLIKFFVDNFLDVMPIPQLTRVGLRFINSFSLEEKTNTYFSKNFNSVFPLKRFKLDDTKESIYRTVNTSDDVDLIFQEVLQTRNDETKLTLDLDAFKNNVATKDYLTTTDKLHGKIKKEFFESIKNPIKKYMRG